MRPTDRHPSMDRVHVRSLTRQQALHLSAKLEATVLVDDVAPVTASYRHLDTNRKGRMLESDAQEQVAHENALLMSKIYSIHRGSDTHAFVPGVRLSATQAPQTDMDGREAITMSGLYRGPGTPSSLHFVRKGREYRKIVKENHEMTRRFGNTRPVYSTKGFAKEWVHTARLGAQIRTDHTAGHLPATPSTHTRRPGTAGTTGQRPGTAETTLKTRSLWNASLTSTGSGKSGRSRTAPTPPPLRHPEALKSVLPSRAVMGDILAEGSIDVSDGASLIARAKEVLTQSGMALGILVQAYERRRVCAVVFVSLVEIEHAAQRADHGEMEVGLQNVGASPRAGPGPGHVSLHQIVGAPLTFAIGRFVLERVRMYRRPGCEGVLFFSEY